MDHQRREDAAKVDQTQPRTNQDRHGHHDRVAEEERGGNEEEE